MLERCHATNRNGKRCTHFPMVGQRVCHMHGGKSPQALRKAEERMRDLVDPAIASLRRQIDADEFPAVKFVLEYAGFRIPVQVHSDQAVTIRVVREEQPVIAIERALNNGHDQS